MDLWDVGRIVIKRWYVSVPVLVGALVLAVLMSGRIDPEYSTEASILLVAQGTPPPADLETLEPGDTVPPGNALLNLPSSLATVAQATSLAVSSDQSRTEVADAGLEPTYEVTAEARSPLLYVRVTSRDSEVAIQTMDHVVGLIERDLDARQDQVDAPEDGRIGVELLARSDQAVADQGGRSRVRLAVVGLGVLAAVALAVLFDAAVGRRRRGDGTDIGPAGNGDGSGDDTVAVREHPWVPDTADERDGTLAPPARLGPLPSRGDD